MMLLTIDESNDPSRCIGALRSRINTEEHEIVTFCDYNVSLLRRVIGYRASHQAGDRPKLGPMSVLNSAITK